MSIREESLHQWFAVQVWAGREQRCAEHLRMRGYDVFLPCYRERRRWSDRVKIVELALFTGYVFCQLRELALGKVVTTPGVIRLVGDGQEPIAIPTEEIEAVQRIAGTDLAVRPWPFLVVGQRVRIEAGPLRDTEGIVVRHKAENRLVVSIAILQRSVAVDIDASWVTTLPPIAAAMPRLSARATT